MENIPNQTVYNNDVLSVDKRTIGIDESDVRIRSSISYLQTFRQILDGSFAFFVIEFKQRLYIVYRNEPL